MTEQAQVHKTIEFPGTGCSVADVAVTPLGDNKYRLEEAVPFSECTAIYDVIKAKQIDGDTIQFLRVTEQSNWKTHSYGLRKEHVDSSALDAVTAKLEAHGAIWEQWFDGLLFVYVPPDSGYNPDDDVAGIIN